MKTKKIITLTLSALLLLPATVYAKGNNSQGNNSQGKSNKEVITQKQTPKMPEANKGLEKKDENQTQREDKKQQIENFKTQMKQKHETMKQLKGQINQVKSDIQTKKTQLEAITNDLESGKKTLPDDLLNQLLEKLNDIKSASEEVKATSNIKQDADDAQNKVNQKDFNNALSSMDKVIGKLSARLSALQNLDTKLDEALKIANLAAAPAESSKN